MTQFKLISGIILILIGVVGGAYLGLYILIMGIIEIFREGNVFFGALLIFIRAGVSIIVAFILGMSGLTLITSADNDIEENHE